MSLLRDEPVFHQAAWRHMPTRGLPTQQLQGAHVLHWPLRKGHEALEPSPCCKAAPRSEENVLPGHAAPVLSSPTRIPADPSSGR